jgi:hypothetical protein
MPRTKLLAAILLAILIAAPSLRAGAEENEFRSHGAISATEALKLTREVIAAETESERKANDEKEKRKRKTFDDDVKLKLERAIERVKIEATKGKTAVYVPIEDDLPPPLAENDPSGEERSAEEAAKRLREFGYVAYAIRPPLLRPVLFIDWAESTKTARLIEER